MLFHRLSTVITLFLLQLSLLFRRFFDHRFIAISPSFCRDFAAVIVTISAIFDRSFAVDGSLFRRFLARISSLFFSYLSFAGFGRADVIVVSGWIHRRHVLMDHHDGVAYVRNVGDGNGQHLFQRCSHGRGVQCCNQMVRGLTCWSLARRR